MQLAKALAAVASMTVLVGLTACGSDDNRPGASAVTSPGPTGTIACTGKDRLTAEGSSAQQNAMAVFTQMWSQYCPGKGLSYNPTGSGAGREQFIAGHADFAGSDSPLTADQIGPAARRCGGYPAWDLPLVFGPIALVYNVPGLPTLTLNGDALAKIFTGRITSWNDPILAALNPGQTMPDLKITPIYRVDSSGTTDNLQEYLTVAAPESWTKGVGGEFRGGVGEGAPRSSGVVQAVRTAHGGIGYVEKGFADQAGLPYAQLDSGNGVVPLTNDTAAKAVASASFVVSGNDLVLDMNSMHAAQRAGTYPLMLATYEIVCSKGYDAQTALAVRSFLTMAATNGQAGLPSVGYVPLPDKVKERLIAAINAMQ
ncbi:phosphate ABC transporter substrate-binding protein PstS [Mycobacterium rhizamassiliense]|uniref:phosphate ABC transporter substrate-binding protein PstS n=1 Tax=Mycobacterium rhizamassiliense TaxID=1841860 RepID=UPI00097DA9BB